MDFPTLGSARKFVEESLLGLGAIKGASCIVQSIVDNGSANEVTFRWTGDDGTVQTSVMSVDHGVSIESVTIDENNHLICAMSNGDIFDSGEMPNNDSVLAEALTANVAIGQISVGKTYEAGTSLEEIIRDILTEKIPPALAISISPSATLYDEVTGSISNLTINATVTKKTNVVSKIEFFINNTLVHTTTTGVASGGAFPYIYNTTITDDTTIKVVVTDTEGLTSTQTKTITFIGNSYYGIVDATVSEPEEALVKTLNKTLKNNKKFLYEGITCDYNKVIYAYPSELGKLTSIMDKVNNFNYTNSFQLLTKTIDGIEYYVYVLIDPTGADNVALTFE